MPPKPAAESQSADRGRAGVGAPLDLSRALLPDALAPAGPGRAGASEDELLANHVAAAGYLHLLGLFEDAIARAARARAAVPSDAAAVAPLTAAALRHGRALRGFRAELARSLAVEPEAVAPPEDLHEALLTASPWAVLILALQMKLVTQQHYLACVRGDRRLEPRFVALLKEHWAAECGGADRCQSVGALQRALARAPVDRVAESLRDYRRLVRACDDVLGRQAALDLAALARRGLGAGAPSLEAHRAAYRKTFLTMGIVNASFVYALRCLGPTAPAALAGVVASLSGRA